MSFYEANCLFSDGFNTDSAKLINPSHFKFYPSEALIKKIMGPKSYRTL